MSDAAKRRLLDRVRPDASKTGRVVRILSTTHDLDADFFDSDFLCTALSVSRADFNGYSGQLVLQRRLAELEYCGVLCEATAYRERPSLRTVVHPVTMPGCRLHAKLVVIEYEHAVRLLVGSANITSAGYRHNRELCGEHVAYADDAPSAASGARILRDAERALSAYSDRAGEFLAELATVRQRLEQWGQDADRESLVVWSDGTNPLYASLVQHWPAEERINRIRIVSPFLSEDGTQSTPLRRLLAELQTRNLLASECQIEMLLESVCTSDGSHVVKHEPPFYFADFPAVSVQLVPVAPDVDPNDLDVKIELTAARALHAKLVVLESERHALAYAGSANFTRKGWALHEATPSAATANIEAGWVFDLKPAQVAALLPPRANQGRNVRSLEQPLHAPAPTDEEELNGFWPAQLLAAELTPHPEQVDSLHLSLVWSAQTPPAWRVHVGKGNQDGPVPTEHALCTTAGGAEVQAVDLAASDLEAILRERHIAIVGQEGTAWYPVNVAAGEARLRLPLAPDGATPNENDLLAYYQGRITFDDLYPDLGLVDAAGERTHATHNQGVDKMRIQAYQIRAFVDALPGIRRELLAAQGSRGALYQAFLGEVSPLALAKQVVTEVEAGRRSATAAAFQLVELASLLASLQGEGTIEGFAEVCAKAQAEVMRLVGTLRAGNPVELGPKTSFERYRSLMQGAAE